MATTNILHNAHLEGDPFLWQAGSVGVLLSHGYTATPAEVILLARRLHEQGYTVAGPLLPGHGTIPQEMNRSRWQDWAKAMETSYQELAQCCQHIVVGGESMGALLALYTASQHPEIKAVLTYSPALCISRKAVIGSYLLAPFMPHMAKGPMLEEFWQGYKVNPLKALTQLHKLQRQVRPRLPHIQQPLLIVQGRLDTTIDLRGVEQLYQQIGSQNKELHWMENSGHMVIIDKELDEVTDITLRFLAKILQRGM